MFLLLGNIIPAADIQACLRHVLSLDVGVNKESVGVLTGGGRAEWSAGREHIASLSSENAQGLADIDSALFAVCLDDDAVAEEVVPCMRKFLHGDGLNRSYFTCVFR